MKIVKSIIVVLVCTAMILPSFPLSVIALTVDSSFEGYTPISTKEDLNNVRNNLSGRYYLTNDIVFSENDFLENGDYYNNGMGWNPIGTFYGIFNGNGFSVKNLYINVSKTNIACVGLFSYNNGTIENLQTINSNIVLNLGQTYSNTVDGYIGAIAGYNRGEIYNCCNSSDATGNLNASATSSNASMYIGGIVGYNSETATIKCSGNVGNIALTTKSFYSNTYTGGICGYSSGVISECYNIGDIEVVQAVTYGHPNIFTGGVSGYLKNNSISDSYNAGNINTEINCKFDYHTHTGGIVGYLYSGELKNGYNIGVFFVCVLPVPPEEEFRRTYARQYTGGIAGYNYANNTINNCYYINTLETGVGLGTDYTVKCNDQQMKSKSNYLGYDFINTWEIELNSDYLYPKLKHTIYLKDEIPYIYESINYGLNKFSFGEDIFGYAGDEIRSLLLYTSQNENIASLNITSSNPSVVEIGTIEIGVGEYITTSEYEHIATVPLKLKSEGTATITVTSPEGLSTIVNVKAEEKSIEDPNKTIFSPQKDGWSFVNGKEGFDYESTYFIPAERYAKVFGNEYVAAATTQNGSFNSMIDTSPWGGNCYGMSTTAILFNLGLLDWSKYDAMYSNDFSTVNKYYNDLKYHYEMAGLFKWAYASSGKNSAITELIECYQILQRGSGGYVVGKNSTFDLLENNYYKFFYSSSETEGAIYNHVQFGSYIESIYNKITNSKEPLVAIMYGGDNVGHAMVIRTDVEPKYVGDGWYRAYVYDPNHPYLSDEEIINKYDIRSYYLNLDSDDTYIELNPLANKWRYNGSINASSTDQLWGCDENDNVKYYYSGSNRIPEVLFVCDLSSIDFPTSFNGTEKWKTASESDVSLSITNKTNLCVNTTDGKVLEVVNGQPFLYNTSIKYIPNVGYTDNESTNNGGKIIIPYSDFSIDYISGDDVSIIDNDSVINLACDGAATISISMKVNQIDIQSDADNQIVTQITDVSFESGYSSVCAIGALNEGDEVSFSLIDDNLMTSNNIRGSSSLNIFTDNETEKDEKYIATISAHSIDLDISDVRNIENLSSIFGEITSYGDASDVVILGLLQNSIEIGQAKATNNSYSFESIPAGEYTLEVSKDNHVSRTYEVKVTDTDVAQNVKICLFGDVNGDGKVNTIDVNRVYAHVRGTNPLTDYEMACANVAGTDTAVNTIDVNRIYAHVKGTNLLW